MNAAQIKRVEIISNLSFVPVSKLDEINNFIQYILYSSNVKERKPISVRGIWENKGFENIDLERELKNMRQELQEELDKKEFV